MTQVVILGTGVDFKISEANKYKKTHELIMDHGKKKDVEFINTSVYEFDPVKGIFRSGQVFDGNHWRMVRNISPDRVWYKSNKVGHLTNHVKEQFDFMNDLKLVLLANNKYDTSQVFKDISPETHRLAKLQGSAKKIQELSFDNCIIKPSNGSGGSGIFRVKKNELKGLMDKLWYGSENLLVQEFVDMECGVPGVIEGIHDLRFSIFGEELFPFVYVRKPKEGDFRSNISAGGTDFFVEINKIPKQALKVVNKVRKYIDTHIGKSLYTIDIVNTTKGYMLMEINSSPGFMFKEKDIQSLYFDYIIKTLK